MKATELRIGNRIIYEATTHIVTAIGVIYPEDVVSVWENDKETPYRHKEDEIDPIPLTEEWLLKFGAVKTFDNWQFTISVGAITLHFRRNNEWYSELGGIYLGSKIKYVHQLQNLYFALTGNELELK